MPLTRRFYSHNTSPDKLVCFVYECSPAAGWEGSQAVLAQSAYGAPASHPGGPFGRAYGIACTNAQKRPLAAHDVQAQVAEFLDFARSRSTTLFHVGRIGGDSAALHHQVVAHWFALAPANVALPSAWRQTVFRARQQELPL